jgi:cytidyltransferase-like protein
MTKKVFVSGCFDLLHSGHIQFFHTAAAYGDLYVAVGADKTIYDLKGRTPVNSEQERLFMIQSISCVKNAFISSGSGILDFEKELIEIQPDILIVNEDGNIPEKEKLCCELGIEYLVLKREPSSGLEIRSTTSLRNINMMPYRIDVAGGWLDQPWVSELYPGPVITVSIEPTLDFNERSGMASSTRLRAIDLWGPKLPVGDERKLAQILFAYDNPPGTKEISGSQDSIGIVFPGLNKADYCGKYWPSNIISIQNDNILSFIEKSLYLIPLGPRHSGYSVLSNTRITAAGAKALSMAANYCWDAILSKDICQFGKYFRESFEAQIEMFPNMLNPMVVELINQYKDVALGWKLSGAGGGGYLILVSERPVEHALQICIRRGIA